jgi:hypothetical protein
MWSRPRNEVPEREFLAGRPGNGPFILRGAEYGLRLHDSYRQTLQLRDWMRASEAKLNGLVRPPPLDTILTFSHPELRQGLPLDGLFWGPQVYDDALAIYEKARTLADTLVKMVDELERPERRAMTQILGVQWLTMVAAASLLLRVDVEGANREPLGRREIALMEMTFGLRGEDDALGDSHLDYLSSQMNKVASATAMLAGSDIVGQLVGELPGNGRASQP